MDCGSSWDTAESEAQTYGGHLATIRSQSEQNWISSTFGSFGGAPRPFFIGLSDQAIEGTFVWANLEAVTFTNWGTGEPNNARAGEDFVYVNAPGSANAGIWNDVPSPFPDFTIYGVIEVDVNVLTSAVNPVNGHTYYLIDPSDKSWLTAEAQAQILGGHLVSINDAQEQNWVYSRFSNFAGVKRYLWIGLTDKDSVGTFTWTNGALITYTNWLAGEPNGQRYVHMWSPDSGPDAGKWNDNNVSVPGFEFAGVVEVPTSIFPTPTPKPKPNAQLIAQYLRQYLQLKKKLVATKHIQNPDRRKKAVHILQKKIKRLKRLIAEA